eukprot:408871_1
MGNIFDSDQLCPALHNISSINKTLNNTIISKISKVKLQVTLNKKDTMIVHEGILLDIDKSSNDSSYQILIIPDYVPVLKHFQKQSRSSSHFTIDWPVSIKYGDLTSTEFRFDESHPLTESETCLQFDSLMTFTENYAVHFVPNDLNFNVKFKSSGANHQMKNILHQILVKQKSFPSDVVDIIYLYSMHHIKNLIIHPPYIHFKHKFVCTSKSVGSFMNMKYIDLRNINQNINTENNSIELSLLKNNAIDVNINIFRSICRHLSFPYYIKSQATNNMHVVLIPHKLHSLTMIQLQNQNEIAVPFRLYKLMFPEMFIGLSEAFEIIDNNNKEDILNTKIVCIYPYDMQLLLDRLVSSVMQNGFMYQVKSSIVSKFGGIVIYEWTENGENTFAITKIGDFLYDTLYISNMNIISNVCAYTTLATSATFT